jgi:hypothetical protein
MTVFLFVRFSLASTIMILSLSPFITIVLLKEWISMSDLLKLNTSFCNFVLRSQFLKLIRFDAITTKDTYGKLIWQITIISDFCDLNWKRYAIHGLKTKQSFYPKFVTQPMALYKDGLSVSDFLQPVELNPKSPPYQELFYLSSNVNPPFGIGQIHFKAPIHDRYTGEFIVDITTNTYIRNGYGLNSKRNGDRYVGNWLNNVYSGFGKLTFQNGDIYEGYFVNGLREGKGQFAVKNGILCDGVWRGSELIV